MRQFLNKKNGICLLVVLGILWILPLSAKAEKVERIAGSMTKIQYQSKYDDLNKQQNEAWNNKYNFKPETNAVTVTTWDQFKNAFSSNNISKIRMKNDITAPSGQHLSRTESIEIDGQGNKLTMLQGTLNTEGLATMNQFTKNFSDTPLFHIHDIEVVNGADGATYGGNYWAFINGNSGLEGTGGRFSGRRGIWRYRIGNLITPKGSKGGTQVGGRLINGCLAETSMWGYNYIVTGAENFYTGGITIEPYSYYRGENTINNFSTVWFRIGPDGVSNSNANKAYLTGTQNFDIGEGSFVYLNNTRDTSKTFPAVFEWYKELRVGKNATYNANIPGTAVSFNLEGAKFIGETGSKVNLLSRSSGEPTVSMSNSANVTAGNSPKNTSFQMAKGSELYVVGTNSKASGNVDYGNNLNGTFTLDNPDAFDIRNLVNSPFLGQATGTNGFNIVNSDISLWKNATQIDGIPDIDTNNVTLFSVVPVGANGQVTSSDPKLSNGYVRNQFKRISGFNSEPELLWEPVTDADASQKARILLGYVPLGGSDPFDENGDAKVIPVYADGNRIAKADFTDTLGNKYTAKSEADSYLYWTGANHDKKGFQIAGQEVSGVPFRVDSNNQRYRDGEKASTKVVDATPPEPAKVDNSVTTVSKNLTGTGEPGSKLTVTINDVKQNDIATTVGADGKWSVSIPDKRLKKNDKVQIFLQDNAPQIVSDKKLAEEKNLAYLPANRIPATNSATGNINPKDDSNYSDAKFKAATILVVKEVEPPMPKINKVARALTKDDKGNQIPQSDGSPITQADWKGKITKVNNTLSYRVAVQIPGKSGEELERILYNAKITDKIPDYLTFKKEDVKVWKYTTGDAQGWPQRYPDNIVGSDGKFTANMGDIDLSKSGGTPIQNPIVEYDQNSRLLTVGVGDRSKNDTENKYNKFGYEGSNKYGYVLPGDKVVIEFPTKVTPESVKNTIKNTGKISGYSAEQDSSKPGEYLEVSATSNEALSPGGDVIGELLISSAPEKITFSNTKLIDYQKTIGVDGGDKTSIDKPLIVKDTLKDKKWQVNVTLTEDMTFRKNGRAYTLPNSLNMRYQDTDHILKVGQPEVAYKSNDSDLVSLDEEFNISDGWEKAENKDGLKMKASKIPQTGTYVGSVRWSLENTQ
ncbi:pectate lyase-like adhesive domain-containing protein [Vagococcus hydrophili]|uniref:Bacterial Ig domain-containing protein n=1 Tax=Vagococcus hydrophili TaxID=2714947 RepID=A0A6G8AT22_9ENTE|nr:pectate lyase-like adhesive domain-containing protein [Vagococcus hydrophili]QIL48214.1 hypothetical protein G7082_06785 [Vagococcus hydrophili]